uniref:Uncharacterized protein n=1 Tax=Anguilla anguilla TaxID=7936 RepID=A0A0E9XFE2_ANGAN
MSETVVGCNIKCLVILTGLWPVIWCNVHNQFKFRASFC